MLADRELRAIYLKVSKKDAVSPGCEARDVGRLEAPVPLHVRVSVDVEGEVVDADEHQLRVGCGEPTEHLRPRDVCARTHVTPCQNDLYR